MSSTSQPLQRQRVTYAWLVHIFTMTGVIWACLAIAALFQGEILQMWMWLGIALIVDGLDGNLARKADVKKYAPNFDGTVLDIMVDYLTWTFIPALFMYIHLPLGGSWTSAAMFALICTSSVFTYCNVKLKTHDYYFMGFPAAWNIVAVVMWIVGSGSALNVTVTIVLALLTVAPLTFVHPFRVARLMPMNIATAFGWIVTTAILLIQHPERALVVEVIWWACGAWLMGLSAYRTVQEIRARSKAVVGNQ
ncbi:CDP-alcohol phosphatidyltransferase family protein [Populibacterium corticicola]|jgi:phosphatidylcholine synthase|uniref:Phosphatidylcholine synthase n=1 Tax=Populibacterium corticicola TaxID=1812826 RepID=A0ABW5XIU7_9MICO